MSWSSCVPSNIRLMLSVIILSYVEGIGLEIKPGPYQDITLVCDITFDPFKADPTCQVFWMRDKHEIDSTYCLNAPSPYLLIIMNATFQDSGEYYCGVSIASKGLTTVGVNVSLTVYKGVPNVTVPYPIYHSGYGYDLTLKCIIISSPNLTLVYWQHTHNGTLRNITSNSPDVYGVTLAEPSLTLRRVTPEDSGLYTCVAVNKIGTGRSEPTTLTVLGVPIVSIPNAAYDAPYGSNITLQCIIESSQNHRYIYWQHISNGTVRNITSNTPGVHGATVTDPSLSILRVTTSDSGQYICFAVNRVETGQSEVANLTVFYSVPTVTIPNAVYDTGYGYNMTLECIIFSRPTYTYVYWHKIANGTVRNITSNTPGVFGATVAYPSLTIIQITREDAGQYICLAVNTVGTGKSRATNLTVSLEKDYPIVTVASNLYMVVYGRSLTIECSVSTSGHGSTVREIYWQFINNGVITKIVKETVGISGSSIEVPSLTILNVTTSESGVYTCFARNDVGTGHSTPINVTVIGDVPIVYVADKHYSIGYGKKVILSCHISSSPSVRQVYWEKVSNGRKNVLSNWTVGVQGLSTEAPSLTIEQSTTTDIGTYRCVAINDVGTGKSSITSLDVIGELPIVSVKSDFPTVKYGDQASMVCVVKAFPVSTKVYWEKTSDGITKVINKGTFGTNGMTVENPSLILLHATDSDSGLYKCVAVNKFGIGYSSYIKLTVIGGLPEVVVPSMTHLTVTGYTVTLSCVVHNIYPAVYKVYWQRYIHGSITIITSTSIGIKGVTVENPSLIIPSTMESMTGEYTCFAVNYVGTGSSLPAKLTVKAGYTSVIKSEDSDDSENNSTVLTVLIAAVSAIATVGMLVVAYCTYRKTIYNKTTLNSETNEANRKIGKGENSEINDDSGTTGSTEENEVTDTSCTHL